jgi:hypothetical protein
MKKALFTSILLVAASLAALAQTATGTKTITISVKAASQAAADSKADALAEDFVLAVVQGVEQPLPVLKGACVANDLDIYQREAPDAVAPLVPCGVKLTQAGNPKVAQAKLDAVFQKLLRQIVQRAVKDRRAIAAAETARKATLNAADEVDPNPN